MGKHAVFDIEVGRVSGECRDCTHRFSPTDTDERSGKARVQHHAEPLQTRKFVCLVCDVALHSDHSVFFMNDSVFCSNLCRMKYAGGGSKLFNGGK